MAWKVLLVDDEPRHRRLVCLTLGTRYTFVEAADGEEAIDLARREHPDLALVDIVLPGMSGYEICRRLKGDRETAGIKIMLLSARNDSPAVAAGKAAGADAFLAKPFSLGELLRQVEALLPVAAKKAETAR